MKVLRICVSSIMDIEFAKGKRKEENFWKLVLTARQQCLILFFFILVHESQPASCHSAPTQSIRMHMFHNNFPPAPPSSESRSEVFRVGEKLLGVSELTD